MSIFIYLGGISVTRLNKGGVSCVEECFILTRKEKSPNSLLYFLQGAGPTGKNEEKIQVLTDKIDVLLQQVRGF